MSVIGRSAGALGVLGFVGCWIAAGLRRPGYSPVHQAISQLARYGTPDRALMTAGFLAFAVGVTVFGLTVRGALGGCLVGAGLATLGVALFPLSAAGHQTEDVRHASCALVGYATLALAAATGRYRARLPRASLVFAVGTAVALTLSVVATPTGLWQRLGLGTGDAWLLLLAARLS